MNRWIVMGGNDNCKIDALYLVTEDGTKLLSDVQTLSNSIECINDEDLNKEFGMLGIYDGEPVTMELGSVFITLKCLYKMLYGIEITSNYLKMHGNPTLRERTRYKYYKKYIARKE